jgi:protein gp37
MNIDKGKYWDRSWNPIKVKMADGTLRGYHCTKKSIGCQFCWAEILNKRFGNKIPYDHTKVEYAIDPNVLNKPIIRKKPTVYFVCDLMDLFHEDVPDKLISAVFKAMAYSPQHTYLVLTKRVRRMGELLPIIRGYYPDRLEHVWPGVMVENSDYLWRIDELLKMQADHLWVSLEPLLGDINIKKAICTNLSERQGKFYLSFSGAISQISCVIVGGESGHKARSITPDWVRHIRDQCKYTGTPFFFKQWGEWSPLLDENSFNSVKHMDVLIREKSYHRMFKVGKKKAGRLLDGVEHNELPWGNPA